MPKRIILLFLSLLLILNSCTRNIPIGSQNTDTKSGADDIPQRETIPATPEGIQWDTEEITEPTKNPEQMLNDILKELDELEQLMDGTYSS